MSIVKRNLRHLIEDKDGYIGPALSQRLNEAVEEIERLEGILEDTNSEITKWRDALATLMDQPTMSPLAMTPEQRKELWAAHQKARQMLGR